MEAGGGKEPWRSDYVQSKPTQTLKSNHSRFGVNSDCFAQASIGSSVIALQSGHLQKASSLWKFWAGNQSMLKSPTKTPNQLCTWRCRGNHYEPSGQTHLSSSLCCIVSLQRCYDCHVWVESQKDQSDQLLLASNLQFIKLLKQPKLQGPCTPNSSSCQCLLAHAQAPSVSPPEDQSLSGNILSPERWGNNFPFLQQAGHDVSRFIDRGQLGV